MTNRPEEFQKPGAENVPDHELPEIKMAEKKDPPQRLNTKNLPETPNIIPLAGPVDGGELPIEEHQIVEQQMNHPGGLIDEGLLLSDEEHQIVQEQMNHPGPAPLEVPNYSGSETASVLLSETNDNLKDKAESGLEDKTSFVTSLKPLMLEIDGEEASSSVPDLLATDSVLPESGEQALGQAIKEADNVLGLESKDVEPVKLPEPEIVKKSYTGEIPLININPEVSTIDSLSKLESTQVSPIDFILPEARHIRTPEMSKFIEDLKQAPVPQTLAEKSKAYISEQEAKIQNLINANLGMIDEKNDPRILALRQEVAPKIELVADREHALEALKKNLQSREVGDLAVPMTEAEKVAIENKIHQAENELREVLTERTGEEFASAVKESAGVPPEAPSPKSETATGTKESGPEAAAAAEAIYPEPDLGPLLREKMAEKPESVWSKLKTGSLKKLRWLGQRALGLGTAGLWEFYQAEKFRRGTKEIEEAIVEDSKKLRSEDISETLKIALKGQDFLDLDATEQAQAFQEALTLLSSREQENLYLENQLVDKAKTKLQEKLAGRKSYNGEELLTADKQVKIEEKIRERVGQIRVAELTHEAEDYLKTFRETLDDKWKRRYVAGTVEAATLASAGAIWYAWPVIGKSYWTTKALTSAGLKAGKATGQSVTETVAGAGIEAAHPWSDMVFEKLHLTNPFDHVGEAAGQSAEAIANNAQELTRGLQDNLWNEAQRFLTENGQAHDPAHILAAAKQLALDNHINVPEWGVTGFDKIATNLPKGLPISYKGLMLKLGIRGTTMAIRHIAHTLLA